MKFQFQTEDQTRYLKTEEERLPYKLHFKDGYLFDNNELEVRNAYLLYVLDKNNQLYGVSGDKEWNHSFLVAGDAVLGAGMLIVEDGVISVSNESGHYQPTTAEMAYAIDYFAKQLSPHPEFEFIKYYAHDEAAKGIIKEYVLCCIAGMNPLDDEYKEEFDEMVNAVITKIDNNAVFSRFELKMETVNKEAPIIHEDKEKKSPRELLDALKIKQSDNPFVFLNQLSKKMEELSLISFAEYVETRNAESFNPHRL